VAGNDPLEYILAALSLLSDAITDDRSVKGLMNSCKVCGTVGRTTLLCCAAHVAGLAVAASRNASVKYAGGVFWAMPGCV